MISSTLPAYLFLIALVYSVARAEGLKNFAALTLAICFGLVYILDKITIEDMHNGNITAHILLIISVIIIGTYFTIAILNDREIVIFKAIESS